MTQARRRQDKAPDRRRLGRLAVVAGLVAGVTLVAWAGQQWLSELEGPAFETLVLKGERRQLTAEALRERVRPALEPGYFGADLGALRESLEAEPWVASVSVRRRWPSTLELTVREQEPVAVWNRSGFLNPQAEFFVPREIHEEPGPLPELSGPDGTEAEVLAAWRDMQAALDEAGLTAEAVHLSDRRAWTLEIGNGPRVQLGRHDREGRFERLANVALPALARSERVALDGLATIDMRYTNGFSVAPHGADQEGDLGNG